MTRGSGPGGARPSGSLFLPFDGAPPGDPEPAAAGDEAPGDARDRAGRERAVDPRFNVALEASAGTGKTRVLVTRYVNLLRAGVDPSNILAMTFTRKAAGEMRDRILSTLRLAAERGDLPAARWRELRDRSGDIAISTIDAFCLSLLREFPLEADLDPGFAMADDTEVPRLVDESLDRALRICRGVAQEDEHVALVFAQLGDRRARAGLASLLTRRIVAPRALARFLAVGPAELTIASAARRGATGLLDLFAGMRGGLDRFVDTGPRAGAFRLLVRALRSLDETRDRPEPRAVQVAFSLARDHFLTQEGEPRSSRLAYAKAQFASAGDWQTHRDLVFMHARGLLEAHAAYRRDLNVLVSRGVRRMFAIAEAEYRRTLEAHAVLDFSELLLRTLALLGQMEEFAQSRYRLEARYHHVLVDEFQDTSRAQWELVSLLIRSWGEGAGLSHSGPLPPSVFIVGDRKQSIYGFRDADVAVLREASRHIEGLRPDGDVRRSISRSFRSVPALLAFVNDVCAGMDQAASRRDAFRYEETDRFPVDGVGHDAASALGLIAADTPEACAAQTASEIARLVGEGTIVRDRDSGLHRAVRPGDIAILFRTRESHREFEAALEARAIPAYVYKGLGFFDASEIKDVLALLWYLADPLSDLRAAAWMRSRFARLSDEGLRRLAPRLADALLSAQPPPRAAELSASDAAALGMARTAAARWRALSDRLPPAELLDLILSETAYVMEMRGPRMAQARENLKKIRSLVRRIQNRGYSTLTRVAAHLDRLAVGDEANAAIDAVDAVHLMTVHAAKGLEFPIVFVVNLARGTGNRRQPIRVVDDGGNEQVSIAVGDFRSGADEDDAAREREETKRLVYVALTRARDRLYLGTVLKEGRLVPGRGSLAEVLPASLLEAMNTAGRGGDVVQWTPAPDVIHAFRVCHADELASEAAGTAVCSPLAASTTCAPPLEEDFGPVEVGEIPRRSAASMLEVGWAPGSAAGRESPRLLGILVHGLLQRFGVDSSVVDPVLRDALAELVNGPARAAGTVGASLFEDVVSVYRAFCLDEQVRHIYDRESAWHEVPFTMMHDGQLVRGTIDCVLRVSADHYVVLEFKTGGVRAAHEAQAQLYQAAAAAIFPGARVECRVIYAARTAREAGSQA